MKCIGINASLEIISLYLPCNAKVRKDRLWQVNLEKFQDLCSEFFKISDQYLRIWDSNEKYEFETEIWNGSLIG